MSEEATPYYSVRARIGDVKSPKDLVGLKERTIEITIGNTRNPVVLTNPKDVADVTVKDMKELFIQAFNDTDQVAKERGFKFMDEVDDK